MTIASRRLLVTVCIWFGGACVAVAFWRSSVLGEIQHLAPPDGVNSLDEFAESKPEPTKLSIVEDLGATYIVWIGESAPIWMVPSGRSCYVFDDAGNLEDWSWTTGDGQSTDRMCRLAWNAEALTVDEAIQFVHGNMSAKPTR